MKFNAVVIADGEGERRLTLGELPLKIGTGVDCEIRLPGPGRSAVGLLDELDGEPFVQPIGNQGALEINGEVLVASQKVASGDELQFYGSRVVVGESDGAMHLKIQLETSAYVTKPPEVAVAAGGAGEETIVATEFRRAREAAPVIAEPGGIRWQAVVGGVIGVLVLLSWLLFTSKSIQFDVQPAGMDKLSVEGGWFKLPVGERVLMRTGTYTVNVAKQGYFDVAQNFEVGDEPSRTVVVEMRKLPGKLTVSTVPQVEAIVTVDDTRVGPAPLGPVELEPGIHSVTVSAERYLPYVQRISIPGLGLHQELDVQLVPQWADVEISSNPSGAAVYQGTQEIGETPMRLELMEGSHSLSLIKDGFKAWDGSVETVADIDQVLPTVELEPANAQLRVLSIPSKANISVNGRYRGQSPVKIDLSPDVDYEIGLSKAGYGSAT
ncbi:MAG: PEGA domain-containing protein, partial [Woeseiales bacterium]